MTAFDRLSASHDDMTAWRHDIHQYPELAYAEHRTAAKVADLLREFGVDEVVEGVGKTGVVGIIRHGEGRMIGLRADMDALPIHELTDHDYKSRHEGVMHACGHDGHTAMLLGAARHLAETRDFSGTVVLIFQPAEEGAAGAKAMVEDGLFERWPVEAVYGMHNMPGLEEGKIAISPGPGDGGDRQVLHRHQGRRRPRRVPRTDPRPDRRRIGGGPRRFRPWCRARSSRWTRRWCR